MRRHLRILTAAAFAPLAACGIPTEQYDARVAELRKAEEKVKSCDTAVASETAKAKDADASVEEMRAYVRDLQRERKELGVNGPADVASIKQTLAQARAMQKQGSSSAAAPNVKAERERLAQNLKAEVDGGVVAIDDRGPAVKLVIPEEALFGAKNAKIGPPGQKVLDAIAREIKAMPPREILVSAFLDKTEKSKGDADMALTLDRAWHVADYFTSKQGVDKAIVAATGMGGLQPIADNGNEALRQKNRRVEIVFGGPTAASGGGKPVSASGSAKPPSSTDDPGL